jgi:hypothetical protein
MAGWRLSSFAVQGGSDVSTTAGAPAAGISAGRCGPVHPGGANVSRTHQPGFVIPYERAEFLTPAYTER